MNENQNVVVRRRRGPAEIEQLVVEFTQSGMNPREFCVGRGLSLSTLQRYRNNLICTRYDTSFQVCVVVLKGGDVAHPSQTRTITLG